MKDLPILRIKLLIACSVLLCGSICTLWAQSAPAPTPSNAELRRQLIEVDVAGATSIDDYLRRIALVAEIVPKMEKAYQIGDLRRAELKKKYRNRPDLLRLIGAIEKVNEFDKEGLSLLKEEVSRAKWLGELPAGKQQRYFDEQIAPLRKKMLEVAQKEVEFAREMKRQGLALPPDVSEAIK